jgi:hypothetical protein
LSNNAVSIFTGSSGFRLKLIEKCKNI